MSTTQEEQGAAVCENHIHYEYCPYCGEEPTKVQKQIYHLLFQADRLLKVTKPSEDDVLQDRKSVV